MYHLLLIIISNDSDKYIVILLILFIEIFSYLSMYFNQIYVQVFDSLKKTYTAIELDDREDAQEIQDVLGELTGARTVPRVFLNGECLGGGTDVKKLHESGELVKKF